MQIINVAGAISRMAETQPDSTFLIGAETGVRVTFQELEQQCMLLSAMLHEAGLMPGDKVAVMMDNGLLTAQLFLGAMYGGFVAVPLNVRSGESQLSYMLDHCDARIVFVEDQYSALLQDALESVSRELRIVPVNVDGPLPRFASVPAYYAPGPIKGDDLCLLMYSSGSTGRSKGAMHTHKTILAHGRNSIEAHQLTSVDRSLLVLPLYHINAECVTLIPALLSGGSVVMAHRFQVNKFWNWVEDYGVTWSAIVPTIVSELVDWEHPDEDRRQSVFERIRFFRSSSAPLAPALHRQFLAKFDFPLLQAMGSTEGGNVFSNPLPPRANKLGSPGMPWGFETRIVDREGAPVVAGESGEVLLRGAGLMTGYYKDPEGTAAVLDSDGWFHTGDLARMDEDGYFFVVGRSKELIIKGGVNIAPRQIDEVLESHPGVLEAAAVGVPDRYFGEDVAAFAVLRPDCKVNELELLAFCEAKVGHFKTPSRIRFLRALPKGPSGKVQRLKLLDPAVLSSVAMASGSDSAAPGQHKQSVEQSLTSSGSSIEQVIAAAWGQVLGLRAVDLNTNFFALGGDSLSAIQCLSKLREKLPMVLSLSDFFEHRTVSDQALFVRQSLDPRNREGMEARENWEATLLRQFVPPQVEGPVPEVDPSHAQPLSPNQQRLWFMEQLNPDVPVYNEAEGVRLTGNLNVEALETAMNTIVDRHELLRSTIKVIDDVPHAVVHKSWPLRFKRIDLSAWSTAEAEAEVNRLLVDEPREPYDLQVAPGIRVTLIRMGAREHVLILMMHHIICDWSSEGVIWRDLSVVYRSLLKGDGAELPPLRITHSQYSAMQRQKLSTPEILEDLKFWEEALRGSPELLEMPADRSRPANMSHAGGRLRWKLNRRLTDALRQRSREESNSLFTIFAAALDALIYRYTGAEDIPLGIPLADRDLQDFQSVLGFLLHTHVLRVKLCGEMTFRALLGNVQRSVLDLHMHRAVPFHRIVQQLRPERNLSYTPLFQVMLNWRDRDQELAFIGMDGLAVESLMAHAGTSKFDLTLIATDMGDEIWIDLEYSSDLFDEDRCRRMLNHYANVLESIAADANVRLDEFPLLTEGERQKLLVEWNSRESEGSGGRCVHELLEEQVVRTPDAGALVFQNQELSYRELNRRANQLAHYLRRLGVGPDQRVAVCVERGLEMVVALVAVLKAGGAYVPLDPAYPADRLQFMVEDSTPVVLITEDHLLEKYAGLSSALAIVDVKAQCSQWASEPDTNLDASSVAVKPHHLAYVIYTSGSTGKPKGAQIPHSALVNFLLSMQCEPGMHREDTLLAVTTLSFDIAQLEIHLPMSTGARIVIATRDDTRDPACLQQLMRDYDCTVMQATPATWRALLRSGWMGSPHLKILCGGEALPRDLAQKLLPCCAELWNMYGPTETTVWSTIHRVEPGTGSVPIGKPIRNTRAYVLNAQRLPVPMGIAGELYIGGSGVARGYLHRDELTAAHFVADPFVAGALMYRTSDLARWRADGTLEFLGRIDNQIKLRGFRIELGEIEAQLSRHPAIHQAVVIVHQDSMGDNRLVAYFVGADESFTVMPEELRSHLASSLPDYMIPARFVRLRTFPQTASGKVDRKALPAPEAGASAEPHHEEPQGELETKLARIWSEVLGLDRVGRRDNFFSLGGHSLLAVTAIERMRREGFDIDVRKLFLMPTIGALASAAEIRGVRI